MRQAEADLPQCLSIGKLLGSVWCCGVSPSTYIDSRASASVAVQRMDAGAARYIGYYAQQIPPAYYRLVKRSTGFLLASSGEAAKRDAKRDTFKTRYSPVGIRICDLLPLVLSKGRFAPQPPISLHVPGT